MLEVRNLSKSFDGVHAVQCVSLSIVAGKITSLIGPNGAGKTTLFNMVTGFLAPDEGTIQFGANAITNLSPWKITRLGLSRTFQNLRLFRKLSSLQNVMLGIQNQKGEHFLNALFQFSSKSPDHTRDVDRAMELLKFVELHEHRNELADNLSYGQQKLLSIACCLATEPTLLLLDEPVAGVQPAMIGKIESVLNELVRQEHKTVFLIEHDIDFVLRVSDTVIVMDDGKIITQAEPAIIKNDPAILEAYLT